MLNLIWPIFIIISIVYSIIAGKIDLLNSSIFDGINNTTKMCIELLGTICFWSGIMKIATKTKFIAFIIKLLEPINKVLFPKINKETPAYKSVYIEGINNLYEFDCGKLSGWMFSVNGEFPNYGSSTYKLQDGDQVSWIYTCDLGADVGNEFE